MHDIADPYLSSIMRGVQTAARAANKQVLLASTDRDFDIEREAVSTFIAHRADAIVLAGSRQSSEPDQGLEAEFKRYRANGGRIAVVGQPVKPSGAAVVIENYSFSFELAEALIAAGTPPFRDSGGVLEQSARQVDRRNGSSTRSAAHGITPTVEVAG